MLYFFIRPLARITLWVFYRKIYFSNAHNIPFDKPVILAANHPTGFMEPCILACYVPQSLQFLARGDLFVKPFYVRLLRSLHLLPLYRAKDRGFAFVKTNYETFDFCYQALSEKKTLLILAEGSAEHEKRLRPLKKGTGRIAFGTLERHPELKDIYIVPVGVNYTYAERARSEVMIDCGKPLSARQYFDTYQRNPNRAIADLSADLRLQLQERVVIVNKEDDELAEYLLQLDRTERPKYYAKDSNIPLAREKCIADKVNKMDETTKQNLLHSTKKYFQKLQQLNVTDKALGRKRVSFLWLNVLLIIGFPFFVTGYLFNAPPVLLAKNIADQRVRRIVFYSSVWIVLLLSFYLMYWLIWLVALLIFAKPVFLITLIIIPLLGVFSIQYQEFSESVKQMRHINRLNNIELKNLLQQRTTILNILNR